jgi:hypothetical protein
VAKSVVGDVFSPLKDVAFWTLEVCVIKLKWIRNQELIINRAIINAISSNTKFVIKLKWMCKMIIVVKIMLNDIILEKIPAKRVQMSNMRNNSLWICTS